jgi:hypothetical protein
MGGGHAAAAERIDVRTEAGDPIWEKPTVSSAAIAGSERVEGAKAVVAKRALKVMRCVLPR